MRLKVIVILFFFILIFLGEIAISYSHKSKLNSNFKSSEYIPISHSLDNYYSSHYQTIIVDNLISEFLNEWDIKGASVSIAKDGRLVYSKGFGYADKDVNEVVEPKHLFRIASVSKLITAVAVMKLYEDGRLNLDDIIFGKNGLLNDTTYADIKDNKAEEITVNHLLYHTSGWKTLNDDPVFSPLYVSRVMEVEPPVTVETVIEYMLEHKKLDYDPGSRYSYSNFGYAVLGKVIEKVTGMTYENYVKFAVLDPLGIYDMKLGKDFYADKDSNEVKYYEPIYSSKCYAFDGSGTLVQKAYGGNNMGVLGAAGGWIASSAELLKLIVAIDGFPEKKDILKPETVDLMTTPDENGHSLIGWRGANAFGNWWRTGTLAGSSALVMRQPDNVSWVILLNSSTLKQSRIHNNVSQTMFRAVSNIDDWPDYDLFHYYQVKPNDDNLMAMSEK